ncbi:MAG: hypothetical protein IMZ61_14455 [Planctomycetes bacterium]|nr:hypothetical protein [Planctomycetota bacterium]
MRELKFRLISRDGKIVGYEKWYPGSWNEGARCWNAIPQWLYSRDGQYWKPEYILHQHKDQFTGLHDKNGKEIWEGDVVTGTVHEYFDGKYIINFDEGVFSVRVSDEYNPCLYEGIPEKQLKVIGNIYENPELLK